MANNPPGASTGLQGRRHGPFAWTASPTMAIPPDRRRPRAGGSIGAV